MGALWIGVDPGGKTGLVAVELAAEPAKEVLRHAQELAQPPGTTYDAWARMVLLEVLKLRRRLYGEDLQRMREAWRPGDPDHPGIVRPARVAVESLVPSVAHVRRRQGGGVNRINPDGLACAGVVCGRLLGWGDARGGVVIPVRPGGHGRRQPLEGWYPPKLLPPRSRTGVGDKFEHLRAALDVARGGPAARRYLEALEDPNDRLTLLEASSA